VQDSSNRKCSIGSVLLKVDYHDPLACESWTDEEAVIAAMVYVDLNPVRAKIAKNIEQCRDCSIRRRLDVVENSPERLKEAIAPLVSGPCGLSMD
jgi:hypothetical protein